VQTNSKIKLIIFDFDGTLADTFGIFLKTAGKYAKRSGINIDIQDKQFIEEIRNSHALDLMKRFGVSLVRMPKLIKEVRDDLLKEVDSVFLFPGISEALSALTSEGYQLGVLTSNSEDLVTKILSARGVLDFFDFVRSEKHLFGKDKALTRVLKSSGLEESQVLYVGDEARDVEACKKAGIRCIAVEWGFNSKYALNEHGASYIVDSPEELVLKVGYLNQG
jgi:phosphoglycolate phosphatase